VLRATGQCRPLGSGRRFAYDEYVEKLEAMGIKPKNVC
jgi:hypothetical protein